MAEYMLLFIAFAGIASALPLEDPVVYKLSEQRYQYIRNADGAPHLVDLWVKVSDLLEAARYSPDSENEYHLYTRQNPSVSQPLLSNHPTLLSESNFDPKKRTMVVVHGWNNDAASDVNTVLVPAFLGAEDCNVIVVDWSAGAETINYAAAVLNTVTSGESVASFLNWLTTESGASFDDFLIAGHSLGGQQSGVIGRNLASLVSYIMAMDPAEPGFLFNDNVLKQEDAAYTEVIHTNAGGLGYLSTLGHVDVYPNGGVGMAGCITPTCDHSRSFYYFAESIESGGFTATECDTYLNALLGFCFGPGTITMGGITPKTGQTGVYHLTTNAAQPFSQG